MPRPLGKSERRLRARGASAGKARPVAYGLGILLAVAAAVTPLQAQDARTVAGLVVDERSQRPLSGVQIVVEETGAGTVTNSAGRFLLLNVPGTQVTLRFQMIGYRSATQTVSVGETGLRVGLMETAIELDRIVATGTTTGAERRRQIGNTVSTVNAAELVEAAPIRDMQEMLAGRVPGVFLAPSSGQIGGGQRIRVRGQTTFSLSGEPLIYVDGVRINNEASTGISVQGFGSAAVSRMNDINPNEIESIEVIKGPAAATLYGTEAARGVVNIITKRGRGGDTQYQITMRQGANWFADPDGRIETNYWRAPDGTVHALDIVQRERDRGVDIFRTGRLQGYNLAVSGGTDQVRYFVSGDLTNDQGIDPTNGREQFSGRANVQVTPGEKFDFSVSAGYVDSDTHLACEAGCGGRMWDVLYSTPQFLGDFCDASSAFGCGFSRGYRGWTPEAYDTWDITQQVHRFTGSLTANWRPWSWLSQRLTIGRDYTRERNAEVLPFLTSDTLRYFWGPRWSDGYRYQNLREVVYDTYDYSATVQANVNPELTSATSFGLQYYKKAFEVAHVQGEGFPAPGVNTVAAAANRTFQNHDYWDNRTLGFYAQQMFGFNDRLFLTGAVRVDNNSAFGSDVDFVTYPKASLSWVVSEDPLFEDMKPDFISTLRLRTAWGESGQQPDVFAALRTYQPVSGPGGTSAVMPSSVGNPDLKPERGREIELGFEAGLLEDRVGVDFTYYRTTTRDAILSRGVSPSTGFGGSQWVNAGEIFNSGIEASVRTQLTNRPRFGWNVDLSIATNNGEVRKLTGEDTTIVVGSLQHRIGYAAHSWFRERVVSADFDPATGQAINVMCDDAAGGATPCFNEAGAMVAPRVYLGRTTPSFEGALTSSFRFLGDIRLHTMLDFKTGHKKWDNNLRIRCQVFRTCLENMYPENYDPREIAQMQTSGTLVDFVINDASFMRLREIGLDVPVPGTWAQRFGGRSASVQVAARNLATWTKYTGLDPEAMFLGGSTTFQMEQDQIPHPTQFVTTFRVTF